MPNTPAKKSGRNFRIFIDDGVGGWTPIGAPLTPKTIQVWQPPKVDLPSTSDWADLTAFG